MHRHNSNPRAIRRERRIQAYRGFSPWHVPLISWHMCHPSRCTGATARAGDTTHTRGMCAAGVPRWCHAGDRVLARFRPASYLQLARCGTEVFLGYMSMKRSRHLQNLRSAQAPSTVDGRPADGTRAHGMGYGDTAVLRPSPATSSMWNAEAEKTLSLDEPGGLVLPAGPPMADWDRYELLDLLGMGGMGAVYRARDRRLDRILAIKFLLCADPNLTLRFLREAHAQARIDHPNICRVYEVGEVSGRAYIALSSSMASRSITRPRRCRSTRRSPLMRDVAAAVHEAHRLGIVHRDLKPANVMVERTEGGCWFTVVAHSGSGSAALLAKALVHAEKAIALDIQLADAKLTAAEVCLQLAMAQPSRAVVDRGIAYMDQALALNPRLPKAQNVRAALLQLRAP